MIEQILHRSFEDRMAPVGVKLDHRGQDKPAKMEAGMRNDQAGLGNHPVSVKQEIQVQRPRPMTVR